MAYSFDFDLTKISRPLLTDLARFANDREIHKKVSKVAVSLVERFGVNKVTGLPFSDSIRLMEDLTEVYIKNLSEREHFESSRERALFLPHCARKYMDNRCQAEFDTEYSSYYCKACSEDCLINKATQLGKRRGYDVYILPGGSCISRILRKSSYDGVVGVACSEEIKLGLKKLEELGIGYQGVPLIKNGCSNTKFNIETLEEAL